MANKKYRYVSYKEFVKKRTKIILALVILLGAFAGASTILILQNVLESLPSQKDKEVNVVLSYLDADEDFGGIFDFMGLEYWFDGVAYYATRETIFLYVNDYDEHNLTIYFGGVKFEYLWDGSLTETVLLPTKSINSLIIWDELGLVCVNMLVDLWFNGKLIESAMTDANGFVTFENLIFGNGYKITESGDFGSELLFALGQDMTEYKEDYFVIPEKTVIDINYLETIFGSNYPVNVSTLDYEFFYFNTLTSAWVSMSDLFYLDLKIDNIAGTFTFYEYGEYHTSVGDYLRIVINNTWNLYFDVLTNTTFEIGLVAKSGEFTFKWSSDETIVDGASFDLTYFNGIAWIYAGKYTTNEFGVISIVGLLPIGDYEFNGETFSVLVDDDLVEKTIFITSSFCAGEKVLSKSRNCRGFGIYFFLFYKKL